MKKYSDDILIYTYIFIALMTFGHSWVYSPIEKTQLLDNQAIPSFMCGVFWPCYWSVKYFESLKNNEQ